MICTIGAAIHSVRAVDFESAKVVAAWAADRGAPLHAHVSEQPEENESCQQENGLTPTLTLAEAGAISPSFTAVHATHLAPNDIAVLGFDDGEAAVAADLSTVRQPFEESGRTAVEVLLAESSARRRSTTLLRTELVRRSTT